MNRPCCTASVCPDARSHTDHKFTCNLYRPKGNISAFAAIFGPLEARLRDEQIDSTTLDVKIGALHGGEGVAIRSFESSIRSVLQTVILVNQFPRSLLRLATQLTEANADSAQVTLGKILEAPADLDDELVGNSSQLRGTEIERQRGEAAKAADTRDTTIPDWVTQGPPAPPLFTRPASLRPSHKVVLINALSLALLDAAIPARGTLVAAHAVLRGPVESANTTVTPSMTTSPTATEEERATASFVCAFVFSGHGAEDMKEEHWDDLNDVLVLTDSVGTFEQEQVRLILYHRSFFFFFALLDTPGSFCSETKWLTFILLTAFPGNRSVPCRSEGDLFCDSEAAECLTRTRDH